MGASRSRVGQGEAGQCMAGHADREPRQQLYICCMPVEASDNPHLPRHTHLHEGLGDGGLAAQHLSHRSLHSLHHSSCCCAVSWHRPQGAPGVQQSLPHMDSGLRRRLLVNTKVCYCSLLSWQLAGDKPSQAGGRGVVEGRCGWQLQAKGGTDSIAQLHCAKRVQPSLQGMERWWCQRVGGGTVAWEYWQQSLAAPPA